MKNPKTMKIFNFPILLSMIIIAASCKKDDPNAVKVNTEDIWVMDYNWVGDQYGYTASFYNSKITQNVVDNGCVLLYVDNNGKWMQLPITLAYGSYSSVWSFDWGLNSFSIYTYDDDDMTIAPETMLFKIVIFENITKSKLQNDVDISSLEAVENYINHK